MIRYRRLRDLKNTMRNAVCVHDLLAELFKGMPELQCFGFIKNQEYDDNNYYDYTRLTSINGHQYSNEEYEEEDSGYGSSEPSTLPKIAESETHWVEDAVEWISDGYDTSDEEVIVSRELYDTYETTKSGGRDEYQTYFSAFMAGKKLPDSFFVKVDTKLALYHALDHGRFKPEVEFKIFAKQGEMRNALEYARHIIKGRLPEAVENFYFLDCSDDDKTHLQEYIKEFCSGERGAA